MGEEKDIGRISQVRAAIDLFFLPKVLDEWRPIGKLKSAKVGNHVIADAFVFFSRFDNPLRFTSL